MSLARLYKINPSHLNMDVQSFHLWKTDDTAHVSEDFLRELGDPERVRRVEEKNIPEARRQRREGNVRQFPSEAAKTG